ncbi:MAG: glycosyltransferase family 2 protein [Phycisphaerales bacterium]
MTQCGIDLTICTYNHADLLHQTLEAIARLRCPDELCWAVTVINNNCTDHTAQVVAAHQQQHRIANLRMVHEPKQGIAEARRAAVTLTDKPLIAMLDDDCIPDEDWLAALARFAAVHPRAGVFGSRITLRYIDRPTPVALRHARALAATDWGDQPVRLPDSGDRYLVTAGICLRRDAIEASDWLNHRLLAGRQGGRLTAGEDAEMVYRIQHAGYEAWYVPSMRVTHLIPFHRCRLAYLEGLYHGFGASAPMLMEIERGSPMTIAEIDRAMRHARKRARHAALHVALNRCIGRKNAWEDWRLKWARYRGRLDGWRSLRQLRSSD